MKKKNLSFLINKQINKLLFYGDHFLLVYSFAGLVAISCEPESILLTREFSRAISPEWRLVRAFVCPCDLTFLPTFFHLEFIHRLSKGGRGRGSAARMAQDQCGPGSNPAVDAICGLSLLLVLSLAPRGFPPGTPVSPLFKNQHFQIPIPSGTHGHISTSFFSSSELLSIPWVNKLQFQFFK